MMSEFPAAHSMDTTWFAIDSDGHVAVFDSSEAGCVPTDAYLDEDHGELTDKLFDLPATGVIYDFDGHRASDGPSHLDLSYLRESDVIAFIRDLAPVHALIERFKPQTLPATTGIALVIRKAAPAALAELHARKLCLGCSLLIVDDRGDIAARGVYRYTHSHDNWIAGPYARTALPERPIDSSAVPDLDKVVRYSGRFADTPTLQPAELWHCEAWGAAWLASDGKTVRAFAGREDDYVQAAEELRRVGPDLIILDAPAPSAPRPDEPPSAQVVPRNKPWWKFW